MKTKVKYVKAPARRRSTYFFVSFFLTLLVFAFGAGIILVDQNTEMVGWSKNRVALVFSNSSSHIGFTVAGQSYAIDKKPFERAGELYLQFRRGYDNVKSEPERLLDLTWLLVKDKVYEVVNTLLTGAESAAGLG